MQKKGYFPKKVYLARIWNINVTTLPRSANDHFIAKRINLKKILKEQCWEHCLGNVAEVPHLRPYLMNTDFMDEFSFLLDSNLDGIEVSYNAVEHYKLAYFGCCKIFFLDFDII